MLRDDFSERINRVIRGFAVYCFAPPCKNLPPCLVWLVTLVDVFPKSAGDSTAPFTDMSVSRALSSLQWLVVHFIFWCCTMCPYIITVLYRRKHKFRSDFRLSAGCSLAVVVLADDVLFVFMCQRSHRGIHSP